MPISYLAGPLSLHHRLDVIIQRRHHHVVAGAESRTGPASGLAEGVTETLGFTDIADGLVQTLEGGGQSITEFVHARGRQL